MNVYLDNAATTYPKPDSVAEAVYGYIKNNGMNINRGAYSTAFDAEGIVYETRRLLCGLFGFDKPSNVIFCANVTTALNMVLKGLFKCGDHVLVSSMEHNAVMRPLVQLAEQGVEFDRIPCDAEGRLLWDDGLIRENTRAVVMTHASNVCGTIMPIEKIGGICAERGIKFIVDSAQSGGILPVDMKNMHINVLCFTGHKGLYGPQGIGGFIADDDTAGQMRPLISGGTGSASDLETMPLFLPDRFEAGTLNIPGICGLKAGVEFINTAGDIAEKESRLTKMFIDGVNDIGYKIAGINGTDGRTAVVSLIPRKDPAMLAFELDKGYGIMTRVGLHCAPSAHRSLRTFPQGTVRFSFGYFNREEEIEYTLAALKKLI